MDARALLMSPYEQAKALYETQHGWKLSDYIDWYGANGGYVMSSPEFFLMGRPVFHWAPEHITLPYRFDVELCDCWYVHVFAGDFSAIWRHVPYFLPWIAFDRQLSGQRKELRFWRTEAIQRHCQQHATPLAINP